MKIIQVINVVFVIVFFETCNPNRHINGSYSNVFAGVMGEEFKFTQPNRFEYYLRTEGAVRAYSAGTWIEDGKKIILNGFVNNNINILNVDSKIDDNLNDNRDKIVVEYKRNLLDTFVKVDLIVNDDRIFRLSGDTALLTDMRVRSFQVKSYLVHNGLLLGAPPKIDTLFSPKINVSIRSNTAEVVLLKVDVPQDAFYRIELTDTLTIKNRNALIWQSKKFKKE